MPALRPLLFPLLLGPMLLAACASRPAPPPAAPPPTPVMRPIGLERVLGHSAEELVRLFGPADQDVREDVGRKLQFRSPICVLDAYLYADREGGAARVTYVDARQPDGRDIDRASCVAALARRVEAR